MAAAKSGDEVVHSTSEAAGEGRRRLEGRIQSDPMAPHLGTAGKEDDGDVQGRGQGGSGLGSSRVVEAMVAFVERGRRRGGARMK